jgi:hypothetical protein
MREIKFRAWIVRGDYPHKMWRFDVRWGNYKHGDGWIGMLPWGWYEDERLRFQVDPEDCELMQFTGLLDKQGKEIYEGDILKLKDGFPFEPIITVSYEAPKFIFRSNTHELYQETSAMEVIGNIYENPELLEANQ